jgi:oligopeptidase B
MKEPVFTTGGSLPPRPEKKPKTLTAPNGEQRVDEYYWLNERDNPAVVAYLEAENQYAETILSPVATLRTTLFEEMRSRIKEDDNSVPYLNRGYWYYTRYEIGKEYPIYCRKKGSLEATEEIILDVNQLAEGQAYCSVTGLNVSPSNQLLFYAVDYTGRNLYQGRIKNLESGAILPEVLESAFGASVWSKDNHYLFYDTKDEQTLRTDKVWRHQLGTSTETDVLVFNETDETTYASLYGSKDGEYAFINHGYTQNLETHFLQLDQPLAAFEVMEPRQKGLYYEVEHHKGQFILRSNLLGRNFSLFTTPVSQPGKANWKPLLPYREDALVESIDVFQSFMAINERRGGLQQIRVYQWADGSTHDIDFGEPTYDASTVQLANYESEEIRYVFSSLKTPLSIFDYTVSTRTKNLKKVEPVLGGYGHLRETEPTYLFPWCTKKQQYWTVLPLATRSAMALTESPMTPDLTKA